MLRSVAGRTPALAAAVVRDDTMVWEATLGFVDAGVATTPDTVFDLASLTKVVATTSCLMALGERGVSPDDPLNRFRPAPHPAISLRRLLRHEAGLWEWQPLYFTATDRAAAVEVAATLPLRYAPGAARHYSDLGLILLGDVVERVCGLRLDDAFRGLVTDALGLRQTAYDATRCGPSVAASSPGDGIERQMIASGDPYPVLLDGTGFTSWRAHRLRGEVNDGNCFHALESVSGHAGLFSTLGDLLTFGRSFVDPDRWVAGPAVTAEFLAPGPSGQALGWRHRPGVRGPVYWHGGFTGTRIAVQPATRSVAVLLTNRLFDTAQTPYPPNIDDSWEEILSVLDTP